MPRLSLKILTLGALALSLATGCVTLGKHEALQREYDDTRIQLRGELRERDQTIQTLEAAVAQEKAKYQSFIEQCDQEKARLSAEIEKVQAKLASTVKDRSRLKASVSEMEDALAELEKRRREAEGRMAEFQRLIDRFKPLIDTGKLKVKIADGRMVVELATDVLFASGSARLSDEGKEAIAEVANVLASVGDRKYQVEGHTDNVPIRTKQYPSNWELAAGRAITVVKTMVEAGMDPTRLSASSFADSRPAAENDTPEGRAANRRIEIVVQPDLSSLPGFEELKNMQGGGR